MGLSNQPNYKDDHAVGGLGIDAQQPDPVFEDETEEQLTVPPQDTGDTFFGGHGGGPIVTTDSDDYIDSGSISGLTEIYEEQIEDTQEEALLQLPLHHILILLSELYRAKKSYRLV